MARQSFVVQHSKGNGTPWIRDALLRRGWREVPGGGDAAHVRRCLSQSNGLGFCWLRGHDPLVSNYPMEMHATSNRWPNRATSPESLGLGCLWRKDGLLATLDAYYSCQGLDPWQHHPCVGRLSNAGRGEGHGHSRACCSPTYLHHPPTPPSRTL